MTSFFFLIDLQPILPLIQKKKEGHSNYRTTRICVDVFYYRGNFEHTNTHPKMNITKQLTTTYLSNH